LIYLSGSQGYSDGMQYIKGLHGCTILIQVFLSCLLTYLLEKLSTYCTDFLHQETLFIMQTFVYLHVNETKDTYTLDSDIKIICRKFLLSLQTLVQQSNNKRIPKLHKLKSVITTTAITIFGFCLTGLFFQKKQLFTGQEPIQQGKGVKVKKLAKPFLTQAELNQQQFLTSEMAADWYDLMIPQCKCIIIWPSNNWYSMLTYHLPNQAYDAFTP